MKDGRIPKDLLYGELATEKRPTGRPKLRFKDVCKRDLQALGINSDSWKVTATDRDAWRHTVKVGLSQYEETQQLKAEEKRLSVFHMRCLRPILGMTWQDKVTNKVVLEKAGIPSLYTRLGKAKVHAMARTCDIDER